MTTFVIGYTGQEDTDIVRGYDELDEHMLFIATTAVDNCEQHILDGFHWGDFENLPVTPDIDTTETHRNRLIESLRGDLMAQAVRGLSQSDRLAIVPVKTWYTDAAGDSYTMTITQEDG